MNEFWPRRDEKLAYSQHPFVYSCKNSLSATMPEQLQIQNLIEITEQAISVDEVVARVADPANGAVVTFIGVVRGVTEGRETLYLEYEAYPEMAEKVLQQIADEIRARWTDIRAAAIAHRVGRLEIGETAVVIALSASHRAQTFDALRYAIDRIKDIAPIWKKEFWADGAEWRSEQ